MVLGWSPATDDLRVLLVPITTHSGHPERATSSEVPLHDEPDADVDPKSFLQPTHVASLNLKALALKTTCGHLKKETVGAAILAVEKMVVTNERVHVPR